MVCEVCLHKAATKKKKKNASRTSIKHPGPELSLSRGKHRLTVDPTKICLGGLLLPWVADLKILTQPPAKPQQADLRLPCSEASDDAAVTGSKTLSCTVSLGLLGAPGFCTFWDHSSVPVVAPNGISQMHFVARSPYTSFAVCFSVSPVCRNWHCGGLVEMELGL